MTDFPYEGFPYRLEHTDKGDSKVCWFSCEEHLQKYIERYKPIDGDIRTITGKVSKKQKQQLFSSLDTFFEPNDPTEIVVAPMGTRTRRKSTQKRSSSRQSSSS
jgi:hypothetical protein